MGNRNWIIWSVATLCMIVVLGAMGVVTQRFLAQKQQDVQQGSDAYREERIRLAMWRLDTLATSIVGVEDARPAESVYTQEFREISQNQIKRKQSQNSNNTNLYWSLDLQAEGEQKATSPQVSAGRGGKGDSLLAKDLERFNTILNEEVVQEKGGSKSESNIELSKRTVAIPTVEKKEKVSGKKQDLSLESIGRQELSKLKISQALKFKNSPKVQKEISRNDKGSRKKAVERLAESYANSSQWGAEAIVDADDVEIGFRENRGAKKPAPTKVLPFTAIWLSDELVLVRRVSVLNKEKIQGVWLKKDAIVSQLLEEISDLFPQARLQRYEPREGVEPAETVMFKLPFLLIPEPARTRTPTVELSEVLVDGPIGLAWLGVLFALAAGFFMLRAVLKMSERRAAFVSSVTHELRTPLTTFRLYSEMLSSGLVKDEEARQNYLETLKLESERLTHLVENVLSYSRIERGSARAKFESITLGSLINRCEDRLKSRAAEESMQLSVKIQPEDGASIVAVDTTAVEQILFNLVDNATKYASGADCGDQITLSASLQKNALRIAVCDQGQGISRRELKRLFKPFHKSAEQAATTKPGVGLGLSLCRRLARAMGGDLVYESLEKGACFVLNIPIRQQKG